MLFNSPEFFAFVVFVFAVHLLLTWRGYYRAAVYVLLGSSLVFYGWWNPKYVPLLMLSVVINYLLGKAMSRRPETKAATRLLVLGILFNVGLLGVYKYTGFVTSNIDAVLGTDITTNIILPLAISFFTFQQIAFLVDVHDGVAKEPNFGNYALFVTFFPHLIAGPITHHSEMIPQFADGEKMRPTWTKATIGITVFLAGLIKKVIVADSLSPFVSDVFGAARDGTHLTATNAWGGVLCYALQLYFDFSGYSDMAIGLGLLFGIKLPLNFNSPYKASNIIDFWSRWHMTLTRFLTAYVYNPLVRRESRARMAAKKPMVRPGKTTLGAFTALVAIPTMITMFISGLWHGAGWQFIVFGLLHGVYIVTAHGWRQIAPKLAWRAPALLTYPASVLLTFSCVLLAQIFFRAADVPTALHLVIALGNFTGQDWIFLFGPRHWALIAALFTIVWFCPNVEQWVQQYDPAIGAKKYAPTVLERILPRLGQWRPSFGVGLAFGAVSFLAVMRVLSGTPSEFLYFQF